MNGIKKIYAWVEVWVDGTCIEVFRTPSEQRTLELAKNLYRQVTNKSFVPIL